MKRWWWLAIVVLLFWLPINDTDLGWHLRYGEKIVKTGQPFWTNEIGFYLSDYHWAQAYSGYQVLVYAVYRLGGDWGLMMVGSLLMVGVFYFLFKRYSLELWQKLLWLIYFWLIALPVTSLGLRSQWFSILGVVVLFDWLIKRKLWWIPILFAIWVNLHGGFIFGLMVLFVWSFEKWFSQDLAWKKLLLVTTSSVLATLINPFGMKIYGEVWRHSWYPLNQLIAEWVAPDNLGILMIFVSGVMLAVVSLINYKKIKRIGWWIIWLVFLVMAMKARRNLPFLGIATIVLVLEIIKDQVKKLTNKWLVLVLLLVVVLIRLWFGFEKRQEPVAAVDYLNNQTDCRKLFNVYEWGGFLDWNLKKAKVFVDGRMPAWETPEGKSPYTVYLEIVQARDGFRQRLDSYGVDCLMTTPGTFLDIELKARPGVWRKSYEDKMAVVYERSR